MAEKKSPKIIIVGAGVAGISAAAELHGRGFTSTIILEAQDKIGGRIQTENLGESRIELGAQWIHGDDGNPLYCLALQHDLIPTEDCLRYEDPNKESFFFLQNGIMIDPDIVDEVEKFYNDTSSKVDRYYRDGISCDSRLSIGKVFHEEFQEYLDRHPESDNVMKQKKAVFDWYRRHECVDTGCDSVYDASVFGWGLFYECGGQYEINLSRGYRPLLDLLLARIPDEAIMLNKAVECICWDDEHSPPRGTKPTYATVQCKDGTSFDADHVIVTASVGCLKRNAASMFNPPLPQSKVDAINGIGFGTVDKLFLEFEKPFWEDDCDGVFFTWVDDEPFQLDCIDNIYAEQNMGKEWYRGIIGFETVTNQPNVLLGWISGPDAQEMENCSEELVLNVVMEMLKRFTGNYDIPKPVKFLRTMWYSNPYISGSYSYLSVDGQATDFSTLAEPMPSYESPQVLFAGEGTSTHYFSTTHGAHNSGIQAANAIIQVYSDNTCEIPAPHPREWLPKMRAAINMTKN